MKTSERTYFVVENKESGRRRLCFVAKGPPIRVGETIHHSTHHAFYATSMTVLHGEWRVIAVFDDLKFKLFACLEEFDQLLYEPLATASLLQLVTALEGK